jgi:hypothetical protein
MKEADLSALGTGHIYLSGNIPDTNFCYKLSRKKKPQGGRKYYVNEKLK